MSTNKKSCIASLARFVVFIAIIVLGFLILIRSLEYFDPTFDKGYLIDKKEVFYGFFSIGLYIHIISSPVLLVLGSILIVIRIEKYRKLHRFLGYGYIFCATFAMISGLILSCYAFGGLISKLNFFILSSLLGWFAFRSFIRIMKGNVLKHQQDMIRSYILVVSAINLRILSFVFVSLFTWSGEHMYTTIAILSWLPFLLFYEVYVYFQTKK